MFRKAAVVFTAMSCLTLGIVSERRPHCRRRGRVPLLTLENNTGVTFTDNFNPFDSNSFASRDERALAHLRTAVSSSTRSRPASRTRGSPRSTRGPTVARPSPSRFARVSSGVTVRPFTPADVAATFNLREHESRGERLRTARAGESGDGRGQHGGVELRARRSTRTSWRSPVTS